MIPMSCPSCGRRGTVPPDRLNTKMHCKKCDAVFHMDRSGKIVLGDPNDPRKGGGGGAGATATKAKAARAKKKKDPIELGIGGMIATIPGPVKAAIVGGAVVVLLAVVVYPRIAKMVSGGKVPSGLDARTNFVGDAFAYDQIGQILKTAAPGTEDAVRQWYEKARPMFKFSGPKKQGNMVIVQPLAVTNAGGVAEIALRLTAPPNPESQPEIDAATKKYAKSSKPPLVIGYNPDGTFDVPTYWVTQGSEAYLDGAKSLELLTNPPTGDKKK